MKMGENPNSCRLENAEKPGHLDTVGVRVFLKKDYCIKN
jgi:hypothetical protein